MRRVRRRNTNMRQQSAAVRKAATNLEECRQKASMIVEVLELVQLVRQNSSSSSAYSQYDLNNRTVNQKNSCRQDIPSEVYDEIVSAFGKTAKTNIGNHNVSLDEKWQSINPNKRPLQKDNPLSRYKVDEQVVNKNFAFLDVMQCRAYLCGSEANEEVEAEDQWRPSRAMVSSTSKKRELFVIECRRKDIEPMLSEMRNTSSTPFEYSAGSFRKTFVTVKRCSARSDAAGRLVEVASERDYEILSRVKHPNIVILMAACFQRQLINHMTLVLERVDCTLNYYLHYSKKSFTNIESIIITKQIGSAALYLHECGYVHSNISSHNIFYRERPWGVKLASFDLATDIDFSAIKAEIESTYPEESQPTTKATGFYGKYAYMNINPKFFIYNKSYRSHLSMHNYQAPELLRADKQFVFPSPKADVYSLCLLLWELLNRRIPFETHSKLDMELKIATGNFNIKFPEHQRCYLFMDVFKAGLVVEPENRSLDMPDLVDMLENIEMEVLCIGERSSKNGSSTGSAVDSESSLCDPTPMDGVPLNNQFEFGNDVMSPSLFAMKSKIDNFIEKDRSCTLKAKQRPSIKQCVGELFPSENKSNDVKEITHTRNRWSNLESPMQQKLTSNQQRPIPSAVGFSVDELLAMPTTPFARQNYMRRNACLNEQPCSSSDVHEEGNSIGEAPLENDNKVNIRVRIIHNKVTPRQSRDESVNPERLDEELPSVLSRIQFFNSAYKSSKPVVSPAKVYQLPTNGQSNQFQSTAHPKRKSGDITLGRSKTLISELKDSMNILPPRRKELFENKLWKRELSICNKSLNSIDDANNSNVTTPKHASVRETIEQFEKRVTSSSSDSLPIELVINSTTQQATGGNNIGSQKVVPREFSRHFRQRSSDVGVSNISRLVRE